MGTVVLQSPVLLCWGLWSGMKIEEYERLICVRIRFSYSSIR
mgnify:CR=1 FL=1